MLTVVPSPLLEPRYFSIPVVIALLHAPTLRGDYTIISLSCIVAVFLLINVLTVYIYVERSFTWPDGSIARFMY